MKLGAPQPRPQIKTGNPYREVTTGVAREYISNYIVTSGKHVAG